MKKVVFASLASCALALSVDAGADVGGFIGVGYAFGSGGKSGWSINVMATSTRREDRGVAAAGIALYPGAQGQKIGFPVGLGYQGRHGALIGGYDLLQQDPFVAAGYVDTRRPSSKHRQIPAPGPVSPNGSGSGGGKV